MRLISSDNITLIARSSSDGKVANKISIGNSRLRAISNDFRINGRDGRLLFGVNEDKVTVATDTLQVDSRCCPTNYIHIKTFISQYSVLKMNLYFYQNNATLRHNITVSFNRFCLFATIELMTKCLKTFDLNPDLSGLRFSRSIQTPLIQAMGHSDLKLISPERRVSLLAPISIAMESRLGDVSAISLKDLRLKSKQGKVCLLLERHLH